jgi:hypothetical protein
MNAIHFTQEAKAQIKRRALRVLAAFAVAATIAPALVGSPEADAAASMAAASADATTIAQASSQPSPEALGRQARWPGAF